MAARAAPRASSLNTHTPLLVVSTKSTTTEYWHIVEMTVHILQITHSKALA